VNPRVNRPGGVQLKEKVHDNSSSVKNREETQTGNKRSAWREGTKTWDLESFRNDKKKPIGQGNVGGKVQFNHR